MERLTASEIIKRLLDNGFSQMEIERRTGIPQGIVSRIYHGKHKDPRTSTTRKLEDLLIESQKK